MPVYRSHGIDTSGLSEGLGSIAKLFAPPSAQEMYAGAKAREAAASAGRIADLFGNPNQPDFDRKAIASGLYSPNQSFYGVDLADRRSATNNAADNARALAQTRLQQSGELSRAMVAPVAAGATRFNPPGIADLFGVAPTQTGVVELKPGERAALPDGRTLAGPAKPMTMDEFRAAVMGQQPPDVQAAAAFGATPTATVQTPQGQRIVTVPQSLGQQPAAPVAAPTNLARLQGERALLPPDDTRRAEYDSAIAAEGRGQTPDAFRTHADTEAAKAFGEMARAGQTARALDSDVALLGELLTGAPTGITAPTRLKAAQYAREVGLNDVAEGLTGGRMDAMTAANAIVQRLAPSLRLPGSGAQSDRELQNFLASLPSLATQPGGNRLILDTLRGVATYRQAVGEIAQRALRGEIGRADADAQIAAVPSPFARFAASGQAPGGVATSTVQPVPVSSPEEARRLPSGTPIRLPDGSVGRVP